MRSRRDLLRAGGVALAVGLAGCAPTGPRDWAELSATLTGSFDPGPPCEVPVSVDVTVSSVADPETGLAGLELVALDAGRSTLATATLPEVTYGDAALADRRVIRPTEDGGETIYRVTRGFERTLRTDAVPAWLALRVDRVWAGEDGRTPSSADGGDGQPAALAAGAPGDALPLSAPPPPVRATASHYLAGRPPPERVDADHYERVVSYYHFGRPEADDAPALVPPPEPTETPTEEPTGAASRTGSSTGTATAEAAGTTTATDAGGDGDA